MRTKLADLVAAALALIGWYGLGLQFLVLIPMTGSWRAAAASFFSFFTILTNLFVAVILSVGLLPTPTTKWFRRTSVRSAAAVYITIVGVVYELLLRQVWNPQGQQAMADFVLHTLVPILYVMYWLAFVPKGSLRVSHVWLWLLYPMAYVFVRLVRGATMGWYPYHFIDVGVLGYPKVVLNVVFLILAFATLSFVALGADKIMTKSRVRA